MKSEQWKTYRTRFLVKAKRLNSALSFIDHLGRQHCGRKGDYLVESSEGVISIAPRQIFEDIYVPMPACDESANASLLATASDDRLPIGQFQMEPLKLDVIRDTKLHSPLQLAPRASHDFTRARRKAPQPTRSARTPPQVGLM